MYILILFLYLLPSFIYSKECDKYKSHEFVLMELFTSHGCPSCPSANEVFTYITENSEKDNLDIYTLSYHVDYWNQKKLKDPFSSKDFSQRQYRYAKQFQKKNVYTPQVVINGEYEVIGNDEEKVSMFMLRALEKKDSTFIFIYPTIKNRIGTVQFFIPCKKDGNYLLNTALVLKKADTTIQQKNKLTSHLKESNIVIELFTQQLDSIDGIFSFTTPIENPVHFFVVSFLQEKKTLKIVGATKEEFKGL
jgi:hypothetical protein